MKLYKMHVHYGRSGDVEGLFIANPADVEALYGQELYFGEILGKHSEVMFTLEKNGIQELGVDEDTVEILLDALGTTHISGHCPFDARMCYEEQFEDE